MNRIFDAPAPIINKKEADTLDILTEKLLNPANLQS